mmetsp:Transcript_33012/g.82996  ORF Transcript_33012/g.82996 Transcript_33012/m.82996 type:complete len:464 (+) Transcript_33012:109-1500(+)
MAKGFPAFSALVGAAAEEVGDGDITPWLTMLAMCMLLLGAWWAVSLVRRRRAAVAEAALQVRLRTAIDHVRTLAEDRSASSTSPVDPSEYSFSVKTLLNARVVVLLNPMGGSGSARRMAESAIPIFRAAASDLQVIETRYRGHAFEMGRDRDWTLVDVVLLLSGDGLVHEFVNGLIARTTASNMDTHSMNTNSDLASKQSPITMTRRWPVVGVLPCGTGNGMAFSLGYRSRDPIELALQLCEARSHPIQWMRCDVDGRVLPVYSLLSVMAAVASTSEYYMEQRLRRVPWPAVRDLVGPVVALFSSVAHRMDVRMHLAPEHFELPLDSSLTDKSVLRQDGDEFVYEGDVWYLMLNKQPYLAHDLALGPCLRPMDGCMQVVLLPGVLSHVRLLHMFALSNETANVLRDFDDFWTFKCTELSFLPRGSRNAKQLDRVSTSGEVWPENCTGKQIHVTVETAPFQILL